MKAGIGRVRDREISLVNENHYRPYDLNYYDIKQIKRVRLVRRADGYYAQFAIDVDVRECQ